MSTTMKRLISYGLVIGLSTALAVLIVVMRPGTSLDEATAPGPTTLPNYAVLGEVAVPRENVAVACPSFEYSGQAGGPNTTLTSTPAEPLPLSVARLVPPCIHALAWVAAPVPVDFPSSGGNSAQGGLPWFPLALGLALSSLAAAAFVLRRRGQRPVAQLADR